MTSGERIKELRKSLGYTLDKFSSKLGVSKSAISNIERGERSLTEQMLKSILREFDVSENWLRSGEGEMFNERSNEEEIAELVGKILYKESDDFRKRLIYVLAKLDDNEIEMLEKITNDIVAEHDNKKKD